MKWYIIRHAAKEPGDFYNPSLGHQDQPISARGRAEAERLYPYFADKSIAQIYVSAYVRTKQTIADVARRLNIAPIVDSRLNEIDNGLVDGLSGSEIQQEFPDVWAAFVARDRDFRFPGGESGADVQRRIRAFVAERQADNKDIIIVSHDGLIRLLTCDLLGLPLYRRWDFRVDTCGIMEIDYQPAYERWKLTRFNHKC